MEEREKEARNEKDISGVRAKKGLSREQGRPNPRSLSIGGCVLSGHGRCHEPGTEQGDKDQALCSHHDAQLLPGERGAWVGWPPCFLRTENVADLGVWGSCRFWKVLLEGGCS